MASVLTRCFVTGAYHCPKNPEVQANKVFVAMPFRKEYDKLYSIIEDELRRLGYEPYRGDLDFGNSSITCKVCQNIQESRYILCEVSDWNPNVLWELGLGLGLGRHAILLRDFKAIEAVPSDLRGIEWINYSKYRLDSDFCYTLKQRFEDLKTRGYAYDFYLSNHWYRLLRFDLFLYVEDNGDTNTRYDITVQKIVDTKDKKKIKFKMPYHDTPNEKTPLAVFNLKTRLMNHRGKVGIQWILKSNVWKRFNLVLPPLAFEETHRFEATLFERSLLIRDEKSEFYDFEFYYPTEKARFQISFPKLWDFTGQKVIVGETGEAAEGVVRNRKMRTKDRNILHLDFQRPVVDSSYLVMWVWNR